MTSGDLKTNARTREKHIEITQTQKDTDVFSHLSLLAPNLQMLVQILEQLQKPGEKKKGAFVGVEQ